MSWVMMLTSYMVLGWDVGIDFSMRQGFHTARRDVMKFNSYVLTVPLAGDGWGWMREGMVG